MTLIMISAGENSDFLARHLIDQSVFIVDALGPATGQLMFEWLGLADAAEGIGLRFLNEPEDP